MTNWFTRILATYDYHRVTRFWESIAPTLKYDLTKPTVAISITYPPVAVGLAWFFPAVDSALGIAGGAFLMLMVAFFTELVSGIIASHMKGEQFSSLKLSRFTLKVFIYLVIIAIPYHWQQNFTEHNKDFMAGTFGWLQNFLIVQIVFENLVSILENMAVIYGNDKTAWINKIKEKLSKLSA
jgi:hypothetical protein